MSNIISPIVVVPDGLEADSKGRPLPKPSFVFEAVLNKVIASYSQNSIFIAPANTFGGRVTEHEAAYVYLIERGCKNVFFPALSRDTYIDTMGNAILLRDYIKKEQIWPLPPVTLVVSKFHASRAAMCFKNADFIIKDVDEVDYSYGSISPIVSRLFYYRYPWLHRLYEILAYMRDWLRIFFWRE